MQSQTEIGEVVSVAGNIITVQLSDEIKSNMAVIDGVVYRIGQVASFLKIPLGYAQLFGIVTQIGASAIPDRFKEEENADFSKASNRQFLNMALIGEQVGQRFERGVSQSPTTGDKVHLVSIKDLGLIYGGFDAQSSVVVGNISASESLEARIDLNKLLTRHCAILGSTGSGKSNAVGVLLTAIANKGFKSSRILVIDPHGEYDTLLREHCNIFKVRADPNKGEQELEIPYWALPFHELCQIFSCNLTDQNLEYFRSKIAELKLQTVTQCKFQVEPELVTADSPIPFSIKKLWFDLDNFERMTLKKTRDLSSVYSPTKKGDPERLLSNDYPPTGIGSSEPFLNHERKGILSFLDSIRLKLKDSTYGFLFNPGTYSPKLNGETGKELGDLLFSWLGGKKPITILDLSGIPSNIMTSISGTLLKIIYDALFWGQNLTIGGKEQPLLIVLEEAHNYLRSGEDSISSRSVQTIAKEGRKYGVGLALVTQRPSELDETVLSQCGTIVALRMNNSKDRGHIRSAIQDELQMMVDMLPSLRTGEGIISGEGVKIPSRIQFFKLNETSKSTDPAVSQKWMKEKAAVSEDYRRLVSLWRNQKLKE